MNALAQLSLRYKLFHPTPMLLAQLASQSDELFISFMQWAEQQQLAMNWTTHLHLLHWLCSHSYGQKTSSPHAFGGDLHVKISSEIKKELLSASVISWGSMGLEHLQAKGILVISPHWREQAVGLWKNTEVHRANKLVFVNLAPSDCPQQASYALSYEQGSWKNAKWCAIHPYLS